MFPYQKLDVYKTAFEACRMVYQFAKDDIFDSSYVKYRLGSASLSVIGNIAKGCSKFNEREKKNDFEAARGAAFECSTLIDILYKDDEIAEDTRAILLVHYDDVSKMLYGMIRNLEGQSKIKS